MSSDDSQPPNPVVHPIQGPQDPSPRVHKENDSNVNPPQLSNPPETPTLPPVMNATRPPEHMTLPERHQAALRHIHTIEGHNTKLYEDNCRLVNAVNMLNDRLAFLGAPQNAQMLRLADMQEKLRASDANRAQISQKYHELLQCTTLASVQRHIGQELQTTRDAYVLLENDYRNLADKYTKLKALTDANRVVQQPPQVTARGPIPAVRPELSNIMQFHGHDQSRSGYASPTSAISSGSFQPFLDQKGNHRRRSSEGIMAQPSLRSGPTPIATTWLAHLPTPPPSAPLPIAQTSPRGFSVHATVPGNSIPLPHHPQIPHDPRALSGLPVVSHSHHFVPQGASERLHPTLQPRQRCAESTDTANTEPRPTSKHFPTPASLLSSPRPPKRPSTEFQTSMSPGEEHKKPRMEALPNHPTTIDADKDPSNKILSPPVSADSLDNPKLSMPDSNDRSYQDCVNIIFEKDADVENGVFCGLCFDRFQAKMIPEPPDVLVQPDFDFLVRHCMTEHPAVWDNLRHKT